MADRQPGLAAEALTERWRESYHHCPPIAHLLKHRLSTRWVRFHSLPESKRYPSDEHEYGTLLHRHDAVLQAIGAADVYLVTVQYEQDDLAGRGPAHVGLHPSAVPWMVVRDPEDPEICYDLMVSRARYSSGCFDGLLRSVADDEASGVIIADAELRWLYHPYDGGADGEPCLAWRSRCGTAGLCAAPRPPAPRLPISGRWSQTFIARDSRGRQHRCRSDAR